MAVICGHFDRATGVRIFSGAACDSGDYCGEFIRSGVHAGMIGVSVVEANCDDTYYGCFDRATGNFSVTIPDDCCEAPPPTGACCNIFADTCSQTTEENCDYDWLGEGTSCDDCPESVECEICGYANVPKYITVSFSGMSNNWSGSHGVCIFTPTHILNGSWVLELGLCGDGMAMYSCNTGPPSYAPISLSIYESSTVLNAGDWGWTLDFYLTIGGCSFIGGGANEHLKCPSDDPSPNGSASWGY
jgi:hypothetical protein